MPPKINPQKLNPLQLKTLTLFQELARYPELTTPVEGSDGDLLIGQLPHPHGNHFHIGARVVMTKDATGLANQAAWVALERKGLIRGNFPYNLVLTKAGLDYPTGLRDAILHGSDH